VQYRDEAGSGVDDRLVSGAQHLAAAHAYRPTVGATFAEYADDVQMVGMPQWLQSSSILRQHRPTALVSA